MTFAILTCVFQRVEVEKTAGWIAHILVLIVLRGVRMFNFFANQQHAV